ncbi:MAG: hypothetical protein H6502_02615 [Candidatus Woesearchaeota archaeon]|nr:MAG: hypothetical protein H6502_02615 [Candidatus Woesearchaeota archaeon]
MVKKNKFPSFAVILLIVGIFWLLSALGLLTINVPWLPIIVIVVAVGMIANRMANK